MWERPVSVPPAGERAWEVLWRLQRQCPGERVRPSDISDWMRATGQHLAEWEVMAILEASSEAHVAAAERADWKPPLDTSSLDRILGIV